MMIIPSMVYAQSDVGTMNIVQEQYTLERTGDVLVKIFGTVELERNSAKISLSHTSPSGEIVIHNVRTTDQGYYEFYAIHNWNSERGNYDIVIDNGDKNIGALSYTLIQDPSYSIDQKLKEEYSMEDDNSNIVQSSYDTPKKIPDWIKNVFGWYYMDRVTEGEVISTIQYLVQNDIIKLD
ncbi:MAG: hypothetical protein H8E89_09220 [Candidatus Nitrosopelagicus sp.]|nr:hypothetical protein [Candidatus Nitrosopelagicus sp.]